MGYEGRHSLAGEESISRGNRGAKLRYPDSSDLIGQGRADAEHEGSRNEASSTSEPAASLTCRPCAPFSTVGLLMVAQTSLKTLRWVGKFAKLEAKIWPRLTRLLSWVNAKSRLTA